MAITDESSAQIAAVAATPPVFIPSTDRGGRLRFSRFDFTQSEQGDDGSRVRLIALPAGNLRLVMGQSLISHSAFGASRVASVGWLAHTHPSNLTAQSQPEVIAADPDGLSSAQDISGGGSFSFTPTGGGGEETRLFESKHGVVLTLTVTGGTIPAGAALSGYFCYVMD